jgi:PKD repeat protein
MRTTIMGMFRSAALVAVGLGVAACGIESQEAPSLIGPSGFAQTVTLNAVPDRLARDGRSQSVITVSVRNESGQAVSGVRLTLGANAGTLSEAEVVTGSDGRASFSLTAPPPASIGNTVSVFATPMGDNFDNAVTRSVSIALTGPANSTAPSPAFTINSAAPTPNAPTTVQLLADVVFDATPTTDEGQPCLDRCSYSWDFGGGATATGRIVTHQFRQATTYAVRLTVTDANGTSGSITHNVRVDPGQPPTAAFSVSPAEPQFGEPVFFDAGLSAPAPGNADRTPIVEYIWSFGDSTGTERTTERIVEHTYARPAGAPKPTARTFTVVLTVVDSVGRRATAQQTVTVADPEEEEEGTMP